MQYSALLLASIAASGAMAAPHHKTQWMPKYNNKNWTPDTTSNYNNDNNDNNNNGPIKVTLKGPAVNGAEPIESTTFFAKASKDAATPDKTGPFNSVALVLDPAFDPQTLRCKIFNEAGDRIAVQRGENEDVTFADGGKGAWTFLEVEESNVGSIVCDETFAKIADVEEEKTSIHVTLSNQSTGFGIDLTAGERDEEPRNDDVNAFDTVNLDIGDLVDPTYRCQIVDNEDQVVIVKRGEKIAQTFGRGDKLGADGNQLGAWTLGKLAEGVEVADAKAEDFEATPSKVGNVICDPAF